MHALDIIIPTMDNYEYLAPCLQSILRNKVSDNLFHIYVVNNGHPDSCNWINNDNVTVIQAGDNLGWEGGLKLGLEKTEAPFVMFLNDDILIPQASRNWINILLQHFRQKNIGAVGPSSNVVMGNQNIFNDSPNPLMFSQYLIGFCFLTRRSAIMEVGGIDDTLPGGDDLDMSIRLRKGGYKLVVDKTVFVYHHGFKTGTRIHGEVNKRNGWNSYEMLEKTNFAIIKKHGFREWANTISGKVDLTYYMPPSIDDIEGELIRKEIKHGKVIDLGCGANKTIPEAIGVDMIPKNEVIDTLNKAVSQADVQANITEPLPFEENSIDTIIMRHIMEHLPDSVTILKHLNSLLVENGRLIIAVPDDAIHQSIPMNIEHVHGFNKQSMKALLEVTGFKVVKQMDSENGVSFITIGEKI